MPLRTQEKARLKTILETSSGQQSATLTHLYHQIIQQRARFDATLASVPTPSFLFDEKLATQDIRAFKETFELHIPTAEIYFATKSSGYQGMNDLVVREGLHIDVSSEFEFKMALKAKAKKIIFTGPGKTDAELALALRHSKKTIVMLDSFGELERLGACADHTIAVGVRVFTPIHERWSLPGIPVKFGIPLAQLGEFWSRAEAYPHLKLQGVHCHMSWNQSVEPYQKAIQALSTTLQQSLSAAQREKITFIDLGGGFYPDKSEADYPWIKDKGRLQRMLDPQKGIGDFDYLFKVNSSVSLQEYAVAIKEAISTYFSFLPPTTRYFFEPGRILSHRSMHIALRVLDVKSSEHCIVDGGMNMIGYEKYEDEHHPVINLTHPSEKLLRHTVFGSLCTPHDIWGYYCYASAIEVGDLLVLPYQGAYCYTGRQSFIKGLPQVYPMLDLVSSER